MKNMNAKARMMVAGIVIGTLGAGILAALIAAGRIGPAGFLAVSFLIALAGFGGWMIGVQTRVKIERDRAWVQGYRQGREEGQLVTGLAIRQVIYPSMGKGR